VNHQSIFNRDIKSQPVDAGFQTRLLRPAYLLLISTAVILSVVLWGMDPEPAEATRHVSLPLTVPAENTSPAEAAASSDTDSDYINALSELPAPAAGAGKPDGDWHEVTVKSGDSLAGIFSRVGIPPKQLHDLLQQGGAANNLKKIYPGQTLRLMTSDSKGLIRLSYQIDKLSTLEIVHEGDDFTISTSHLTPERRQISASGIIDSSLFVAGQKADLSDSLTMELANIFAWDVDFALDIRKGDQFTVLYEELFLDGESIGHGDILAAEFVNHGKRYQAVRYTDAGGKTGYYSLDGKSMRKTFLRSPVEFSRISSGFSLGRKHPILNRIRAHKGVDYAAASGTPIKVTGNGKIVHRGKKGGYGNTIVIQHGSTYSTLYAHMSKFRSGLKVGSMVTQGQTIGYVGMSGLATGPHLHYEFLVNNEHRDPLKVKLPGADPLNKKYMADFNAKAENLIAQINVVRDVQLASNN
jgi:murein DD-endopeptidase MepM/ murein hydrolase activator NlpD